MTQLSRRLGVRDAVVLGLGSMLGAGVFASFSPAAQAAGGALLWALLLAGVLAYLNAISSARLAVRYPRSGGTYVYGRKRLGPFWGFLAGWAFVVGKLASCAAMALTFGAYLWPSGSTPLAAGAVVAVTALGYRGLQRSAMATRVVVAVVLGALVAFVLALWLAPPTDVGESAALPGHGLTGVLAGAGFFFFAFAGYARVATLGEEVRDPRRTIPRAVPIALGIVLLVYGLVGVALLETLGASWLGGRAAPLAEAAEISGWPWLGPVLRVVAGLAAFGALLGLALGVSRTVFAMARDRHLPQPLAAVHPEYRVPYRAQVAVGVVVVALVAATDLRGAIGFSSFCVLVYYGLANASAWTLDPSPGMRVLPALGLLGCVGVALLLPTTAVVGGVVALAAGGLVYAVSEAVRRRGVDGRTGDPR